MKEEYDGLEKRCKKLGHPVPFSYCRTCNGSLPCRQILNCWFEDFDVEMFIKEHYSEEEIQEFMKPSQDKRVTIFQLIQQARERMEDKDK